MLLYLWINDFKHIKKTGFNLSSHFEFDFKLQTGINSENIRGRLSCIKKNSIRLFNERIYDVKAVIGENGAGKSTLIDALVKFFIQKENYFDGFLVTDKYIFNRNNTDFGDSISKIDCLSLEEIQNVDLVNKTRDVFQLKVTEKDIENRYHGQVASTYLENFSLIHYSPLLNINRVANIEGLAGSNRVYETDYWHYYDCTTENSIVNDFRAFNFEYEYDITGESELLAYKNGETRRLLTFLSSEYADVLPFPIYIKDIIIGINDFYNRFWESIDSYLKDDSDVQGRISEHLFRVQEDVDKTKDNSLILKSNIYKEYILGALKYEYKSRLSFGNFPSSNAILSTIDDFLKISNENSSYQDILERFLSKAQFCKDFYHELFDRIKQTVDFVLDNPKIEKSQYSFYISINESELLKEFSELCFGRISKNDEIKERYVPFDIFSFGMEGLSSGESNLLSFLSRLHAVNERLPETQNNIVLMLDEPEVTLHPLWQMKFLDILNSFLPQLFFNRKIQLLITSHSPIFLSDLPKQNVLFLEKEDVTGNCMVSELKNTENTFGANVHALYADAFFMKDNGGTMGSFAREKIKLLIVDIRKADRSKKKDVFDLINVIGDPLIKNQLLEMYYKAFPEEKYNGNMEDYIKELERRLVEAKSINKNESSK